MTDGFDRYIHVEIELIEVNRLRPFDIHNLRDCAISEPMEFFRGHTYLFFRNQQPESVLGNVDDLSF